MNLLAELAADPEFWGTCPNCGADVRSMDAQLFSVTDELPEIALVQITRLTGALKQRRNALAIPKGLMTGRAATTSASLTNARATTDPSSREYRTWLMAVANGLRRSLILMIAAIGVTTNSSPASARHRAAYRYCDPQMGDAVRPDIQALNVLKNGQSAPGANDIDRTVSLATMLRPGDDRGRWSEHKAAQLVGYVADVKMGGVETVNCHARSAHGRDTHIDLTLSAADAYDEAKHVIVEVTPRWRTAMAAKNADWETDALREKLLGRCVRVSGWLLFDAEHRRESENTAEPGAEVWRATAWEVHPVTAIEVLPSCPPKH